jgi:hypothetical protein
MGFVNSTEPAQEAQAKNGEQVPWVRCFPWLVSWSAQQSSTLQQGINVPAAVIMNNKKTSHFFIRAKITKTGMGKRDDVCIHVAGVKKGIFFQNC